MKTIRFLKQNEIWFCLSEHFYNEPWRTMNEYSLLERETTNFLDIVSKGGYEIEYFCTTEDMVDADVKLIKIEYAVSKEVLEKYNVELEDFNIPYDATLVNSTDHFEIWLPARIKNLFSNKTPGKICLVQK